MSRIRGKRARPLIKLVPFRAPVQHSALSAASLGGDSEHGRAALACTKNTRKAVKPAMRGMPATRAQMRRVAGLIAQGAGGRVGPRLRSRSTPGAGAGLTWACRIVGLSESTCFAYGTAYGAAALSLFACPASLRGGASEATST